MKYIISAALFFLANLGIAQENVSVVERNNLDHWELANIFSVEVNRFMPIGNLSETLKPGVGFGLYAGFPVDHRTRIDIGTSVFFPVTKHPIQYTTDEGVEEGGASLSGTIGIWATRVKRLGRSWYWDTRAGTGLGFFQTDIETGKPADANDTVYGSETVFLSVGTAFRTPIFNENIGVKIDYFLVPYNLFTKHLPSDFGMQYVTVGLIYGFK
ncbi:hypothetical protein [Altibacter sp.]|uniref:hypothetical protein n=1 Tax=Altibacter sp. TaxID=2024823 RepID=UPI000C8A9FBC|nr:hypothetical protein [Altibacter sp.]MAP54727.1 hypothetical protein [Altibacter sp.]